MKNKLFLALSTVFFLSGCSISIGGGSDSSESSKLKNGVVYDCSVISDTAQVELTKRRDLCGEGTSIFDEQCREEAVRSVCKPIVIEKNKNA